MTTFEATLLVHRPLEPPESLSSEVPSLRLSETSKTGFYKKIDKVDKKCKNKIPRPERLLQQLKPPVEPVGLLMRLKIP
jgi:hypothetical protein